MFTPNLPTNIVPIKLSGNPLGNPYWPGNSTPLNQDYARVKPSETHNVSREIGRSVFSYFDVEIQFCGGPRRRR